MHHVSTILGYHYRASTQLMCQRFENCLDDKHRVGTSIRRSLQCLNITNQYLVHSNELAKFVFAFDAHSLTLVKFLTWATIKRSDDIGPYETVLTLDKAPKFCFWFLFGQTTSAASLPRLTPSHQTSWTSWQQCLISMIKFFWKKSVSLKTQKFQN